MLICFVYHFYYKTNKKNLIDSRSMNHAEKLEFDPSHDSAVRPGGTVKSNLVRGWKVLIYFKILVLLVL